MKRKILVVGVVLSMVGASLTGCKADSAKNEKVVEVAKDMTAEHILSEAKKVSADMENAMIDMNLVLESDVSSGDESESLDVDIDFAFGMEKDKGMYANGELSLTTSDGTEKMPMESYLEYDGDEAISYTSEDGGENWVKSVEDSDDVDMSDFEDSYEELASMDLSSITDKLILADKVESRNDVSTYKLAGELSWSDLETAMSEMEEITEDTGMSLESLGIDESIADAVKLDVALFYAVEDYRLVGMDVDIKNAESLFAPIFALFAGGVDESDFECTIDKFELSLNVSDYQFELPKDVKENAIEEEEDEWLDSDSDFVVENGIDDEESADMNWDVESDMDTITIGMELFNSDWVMPDELAAEFGLDETVDSDYAILISIQSYVNYDSIEEFKENIADEWSYDDEVSRKAICYTAVLLDMNIDDLVFAGIDETELSAYRSIFGE